MKITKAELAAVAVKREQYPPEDMPEIAFAGRSNVGKSSLFNTMVNRRNFARVSGSPGKTRTINFFEINGAFRIVDLPGYGYAKVSKSLSKDWGPMMERYLESRKNLVKVIQLVDLLSKDVIDASKLSCHFEAKSLIHKKLNCKTSSRMKKLIL